MVKNNRLLLKYLGINTYKDPVVYMHKDCHICKSEGFYAQARVMETLKEHSISATLNIVETPILKHNEASLSNYAWTSLSAKDGMPSPSRTPKFLSPSVTIDRKFMATN